MILKNQHASRMCLWLIAIIVCLNLNMQAQMYAGATIKATRPSVSSYREIQPLTIGDALPSITISNILNFTTNKTNTALFREKLLILDFMATSCKSCIEALPKLDSIQKQFGDKVQILLVSYEKKERVKSFLEKNKIGKQINLAFVSEDSTLKSYFPHEYISHLVWIYKGKVKAITGTEYVKTKNIQTVTNGLEVSWPIKREDEDFDFTQPLLITNESNFKSYNIPSTVNYSTITNYINGVADNYKKQVDSAKQIVSIRMINSPIIDLYLRSWEIFRFPLSHLILEVKDKDRFLFNAVNDYRDTWSQKNCYSYEAAFPAHFSERQIGEKIRSDLNFYFNLNGRMEKRLIKSYVMVQDGNTKLLKLETDREQFNSIKESDTIEISLSNLIYHLNETVCSTPVYDGTNLRGESYLKLTKGVLKDIELLKKELKNYGLILKEEKKLIEMFVLTEKKD